MIENIENINFGLTKLETLHLGHNKIKKINSKNFSNLENLRYLNLDNQKEPTSLIWDVDAFSDVKSLETLNLAGNRISDLNGLEELQNLKELNLSTNEISDFKNLDIVIGPLRELKILNVLNNPMLQQKNEELMIKKSLILHIENLEILNNKEIKPTERIFLKKMKRNAKNKLLKKQNSDLSELSEVSNESCGSSFGIEERGGMNGMVNGIGCALISKDEVQPHLPPYATQYRDLMMQNYAQSGKKFRNVSKAANI
ncbi:hypothetical protein HK099_002373 [Clydaea vesicula]|uniref:Uncharacterized protein n=1 Tax=Clydaea vesicula TaxID=447962 RepID=A0AAD5TTD5_9FUNG|nr:hypothetical protein HK099_002373 [Clydaea vesicula]KAJ3378375.1 hypothetical protein HDU92_007441 [Lobulomyces angularis]